jgi:hypothetical protein
MENDESNAPTGSTGTHREGGTGGEHNNKKKSNGSHNDAKGSEQRVSEHQ